MKKYTAIPYSGPAGNSMFLQGRQPPTCEDEYRCSQPGDDKMKGCYEGSRRQSALESRFSHRAARDVLQDLNWVQPLRPVGNYAIDSVNYSGYQATHEDCFDSCRRLILSKSGCGVHFFLPSVPFSLRPRKSRIAFPIS